MAQTLQMAAHAAFAKVDGLLEQFVRHGLLELPEVELVPPFLAVPPAHHTGETGQSRKMSGEGALALFE